MYDRVRIKNASSSIYIYIYIGQSRKSGYCDTIPGLCTLCPNILDILRITVGIIIH
jgi:hypothetical protein